MITRLNIPALTVALLLAVSGPAAAQEPPRASLLAGFGNSFGWFGAQGEVYLATGRLAGFVGLGFMPNFLNDEGSGAAGAVGVRGFTAGTRHRGFVELSISALSNNVSRTFGSDLVEKSIGYGPGFAVGYQFIGESGLTIVLSGGVGLDDDEFDPEGSRFKPTLGVGLGYTLR